MFRLSRQVRFAINPGQTAGSQPVTNNFGGYPSLAGLGHFFKLDVCVIGEPTAGDGCVVNIKAIDLSVRKLAIPLVEAFIYRGRFGGGGILMDKIFTELRDAWPGNELHYLNLSLSPTLSLKLFASEYPMIRVSQKFEFSASHRLHNPQMSDEENRNAFGKCNNPLGHGHNYVVQVTVAGQPDANGVVMEVPKLEQLVSSTVIEPFDHKNLNLEIGQFKETIPSVENIAMVIFKMLRPKFPATGPKLAGVTVWETEKTWCEYME